MLNELNLSPENPAFKIGLVTPDDSLQQRNGVGRKSSAPGELDLNNGMTVEIDLGKKQITGKISRIHRNVENDVTYVEVTDSTGKVHKVNASAIISNQTDEPVERTRKSAVSTPGVFNESKLMTFDQFSKSL